MGDRLVVVADRNTPLPDGSKTFKAFRKASIDAEAEVAFKAKGKSDQRGIYTDIGGNLVVVADHNMAIPGGAGNFNLFGIPSIDSGHVAFTATAITKEVYTRPSADRLRRSSHWAIRLLERQ